MQRKATAVWQGGLKDGKGTITTESKRCSSDTPYSFRTRFEGAPGTNPEELLGAAHAGCFSMALSLQLGEAGITARAHRDAGDGHASRSSTPVSPSRKVAPRRRRCARPAPIPRKFDEAAQKAKAGCPLSKVLKAEISMDARLVA